MSVHQLFRARPARRGAVLVAVAALMLTGCGGTEEAETKDAPAETIEITITGDEVAPLGERFEVKAGETFPVSITADREGSLHVHSNPEQEWDFSDGTTEHEATIDQPGVVEVEMHDPDLVVLQLEVR